MTTFNEVCQTLGINLISPTRTDLDKLTTYCQANVSQDRVFDGDLQQQVQQCSDLIQFYLQVFLPQVNEDDLCRPVSAFNQKSSLECMVRNGFDHYLRQCHATTAQMNTLFGFMSPLHISATYGYKYTTMALLDLGAKVTTANAKHELPIHYVLELPGVYDEALVSAKRAVFTILYDKAPESLFVPKEDGSTLFHTMACYGYAELLSTFMHKNRGLALEANNTGKLPIHTAILNGQLETTRVLLGAGDPKNMIDFEQRNPLHYAAAFSTLAFLHLCIAAFDDGLKTKDKSGRTPFMLAAYYGNLANVDALLDIGSNPLSEKDNFGKNALQLAIYNNQIEVVERLLQLPGSKESLTAEDNQGLQKLYTNSHRASI